MAARTAAGFAVAAALLAQPVLGWSNNAICVPGVVVKQNVHGSNGTVAGYATALQTMAPEYGDLVSISAAANSSSCFEAAHQVNVNMIQAGDTPAAFSMQDVTGLDEKANKNTNYLYIFDASRFHKYEYMATCIPGGVVAFNVLNMTKGTIGAYTIVLQALMPPYGPAWFLGQSDDAAMCTAPQDAINAGNASVVKALKKKKEYPEVKEVGMFSAAGKGDPNKTYLYVFQNRGWNQTWGMFGQPIISPQQQEYWAQTTTPGRRRRRKWFRKLSEEVLI